MNLNLPLYSIFVNPEDTETGMFLISLVDEPAMETAWLAFNEDKESLKFAVQDEEKHIITGVAIRAGVPIYRRKGDQEFYVMFKKEDIPTIVEKFMKSGFANFINLQHDESTVSDTDAVMVESFFIDKARGIVPNEFKDIEDGSWFVSFKILNDNIWQQIKAGDFHGFSIEIAAELEPMKMEKQKTEEEMMDDEIMTHCFDYQGTGAELVQKVFEDTVDYNPNIMNEASIRGAIYGHNLVILNYTGTDAPGLRQVTITAYGTLANGPAIRVYQWYGDTSSENDTWKFMLLDDIQGFKVLPIIQDAPSHNLDEGGGGVGHFDIVYNAFEKE